MRRRERLDIKDSYFQFLCQVILDEHDLHTGASHTQVCSIMHTIPFNDRVPHDDNRSKDGKLLREEFISILSGIEVEDYAELYSLGQTTLLEVLISLAKRANDMIPTSPQVWFMGFIDNLGLTRYNDSVWRPRDEARIRRILTIMNERTYSASGKGGLFPLRHPERDQRGLELWVQMADFMTENELF